MPPLSAPLDLSCEYLPNPLGLDLPRPRLAWKLPTGTASQSAFQIQCSTGNVFEWPDLWDSGRAESDRSTQVEYRGLPLEPIQRAWWRVRIWDERGNESLWSEAAFWEAGLWTPNHWSCAQWIGCPSLSLSSDEPPAPHFRRTFEIPGKVSRARLYVSAKGLYVAGINGDFLDLGELNPGWTDYNRRIPYDAYDVTSLLRQGENVLAFVLGDGWYCGNVCWFGRRQYGPYPQVLAKLYVELDGAEPLRIVTDGSWRAAEGLIRSTDLLMGEHQDVSKALPNGWDRAGFDDSRWLPVTTCVFGHVPVVSRRHRPTHVVSELEPVSITKKGGKHLVDFGQNMVGRVRLIAEGTEGTIVTLKHAEVLQPDGTIYTENLRKAKQTDSFTLKRGRTTFEPLFTFHGFRYIEIDGLAELKKDDIKGVVLSSVSNPTGHFRCGHPMVDKLAENIRWGMMGNYFEVPTDCPQRDERLGWMGDAQIFAPTAAYNFDIAAFMTKWLQDVRDAQSDDGAFPNVAPQIELLGDGAPAWADAGVIVPWTIYRFYGDERILEESWHSMVRFIELIERENTDLIWKNRSSHNFGDWLNVDAETPKEVLATAYFAHSTHLIARSAAVLGRWREFDQFADLFWRIQKAFRRAFVKRSGEIEGSTQTAYVLAIRFNLLTKRQRQLAAKHLVHDILEKRGGHLSTGFLGVGHLLPVLTEIGRDDVALKLLLNETFPSWGYSIKHGATTIWERWDGWTEEKGFQDPCMNSFNHYALGSCGEWLFSRLAGIALDPEVPGFKRFVLDPLISTEIGWVEASYECPYGRIVSNWKVEGERFEWEVEVPPNTTAQVHVPGLPEENIYGPGLYSFEAAL